MFKSDTLGGDQIKNYLGLLFKNNICFFFAEEWSTAKVISEEPDFEIPINNLTIPVGREAILSCTVNNLGKYKVCMQ